MFNFASEGFSEFESHLNYIIGGAMARELNPTLGNILDIQDLWENMNKILPEP